MSSTIAIDQLRVGMFVHLDLGWWAHPFAVSSFKIASPEQIATLRGLGLSQLRWSPDKSQQDQAEVASNAPSTLPQASPGRPVLQAARAATAQPGDGEGGVEEAANSSHAALDGRPAEQHAALAAQRAADQLCRQQYGEAGEAWQLAAGMVHSAPTQARETAQALTRSLLGKMMVEGEVCIRTVSDNPVEAPSGHALNVAVLAMLMGRVFGLSDEEMTDMGVGALMHDIGKLELPERVRNAHLQDPLALQSQYREHVALGVLAGQRMGLSPGALLVIAQHHEMADGSGFPQRLNLDRMAASARIVSLVNRYDKLCNPAGSAPGLTPHEAISLLFAQAKSKFDASMLNAFIRMMGVYPPGSIVQLTDDRFAMVVSVNSSRPLKPRVLVCDPKVASADSVLINLAAQSLVGVRRSLKAAQLPATALAYLSPQHRVSYFFEPAWAAAGGGESEMAG